jgi:hypothetical protein
VRDAVTVPLDRAGRLDVLVEPVEGRVRAVVVRDVRKGLFEALEVRLVTVLDLGVVRLEAGCNRTAARGLARLVRDELRDLVDLLVGQIFPERRHADATVSHLARDPCLLRLQVVEVRPRGALRVDGAQRVAVAAARVGEHFRAGRARRRVGASIAVPVPTAAD